MEPPSSVVQPKPPNWLKRSDEQQANHRVIRILLIDLAAHREPADLGILFLS